LYEKGIVIVGGGHGGSQAAASLRAEGYEGKLTLLTDETEVPYQRPPLSKAFLKDPGHKLLPLRPESFYEKNDIDLRLGALVTAIDATAGSVTLADGGSVAADRIILATGSRPRLPDVAGMDLDGVFTLRNASDAHQIRERLATVEDVVVVGGGFIGLEIAATARLMGKNVSVLEAAGRLMGRAVAPQISEYFLSAHRGWKCDVLLNTPVGAVLGEAGRVVAVETADHQRIKADIAIIGIGVFPNVELASSAGIDCDNGIIVNDFVETSIPEVLAIGDAVTFTHWELDHRIRLESVQNAVDQARVAALTLTGKREPYREVPWFWSDQGDIKLQMCGLPFNATNSVLRGDMAANSFSVFHFDDDRMVAVDSINRAMDHMVGRRLIAAGLSPTPAVVVDADTNMKALLKEMIAGSAQ
jgi:3-phenylpropionate/trans-cinnamate dioxygenase ferredoxin reductase subunit